MMSVRLINDDIFHIYNSEVILRSFVAFLKLILFGLTLASYFFCAFIVSIILHNDLDRRMMLTRLASRFAKFTCRFMGLNVYSIGTLSKTDSTLMVGNHLSYLDVLVHASLRPACFVTSVEIRDTPVLGQICKMAACVFVERRNRENLSNEIIEVTHSLRHGINVTIFPEATSTNGENVLRFKRPLFQAAIDANVPIIPMTINYKRIDGEKTTLDNRDIVCWYGDMEFFPHLWKVLQHKSFDITVEYHQAIAPEGDTSMLAQTSHDLVSSSYDSFLPLEIKNREVRGVFA